MDKTLLMCGIWKTVEKDSLTIHEALQEYLKISLKMLVLLVAGVDHYQAYMRLCDSGI